MLGLRLRPQSMTRLEWIVRTIDVLRERERRQSLLFVQSGQSRLIANAVVDAEIHIAGVDAGQLIGVIRAGRRPVRDRSRKRESRAESTIDVDAGRASLVTECAERKL